VVDAVDPGSGLFSGLIVASAIVSILLGIVAMSAMDYRSFSPVEAFKNNMAIILGAVAMVMIAGGVVGLMLGKSVAAKQAAMRSVGG